MVMFADRPWEMRAPIIERGRDLHRKYHGTEPPTVLLTEFCVCGTNLADTEEEARRYQGKFVESNFYHYEFLGEHFKTVKGYDAYQQKAEIARKGGLEGAVAGFMQAASWGTPDKILRGLEQRRQTLGDFEMNVAFRFGGTPYAVSERGLKLFAKEVLPVVKGWKSLGFSQVDNHKGCRIGKLGTPGLQGRALRHRALKSGAAPEGHHDGADRLHRLLAHDAGAV